MSNDDLLEDFYKELNGEDTDEIVSSSNPKPTEEIKTTTTVINDTPNKLKRKLEDENTSDNVNTNTSTNTSTTTTATATSNQNTFIPASLMKKRMLNKPSNTTVSTIGGGNSAAEKKSSSVLVSKAVTYSASTITALQESKVEESKPPSYYSQIAKLQPQVTMEPPKQVKYKLAGGGESWEDPTLSEWDPNDFRIFVGEIGNDVTDEMLKQAFTKYPSFLKAKIVRDSKTQKSKGYGFVSFSNSKDYLKALKEMDRKYIGNRPITLKKSKWQKRVVTATQ
ncbi:ssRNA-binding protein [Tieghemostelium lacteum]|uniref:SsRNA-binding protein n=1 Tax=Tieghemostelium lacteum TaxID=361077 RepID=A0A151Z320_TIELA|nr:ssRNA-binding protein [Tieghemostelium lacteum]|eukprot:KYQ88356.1 ssRNA-binding protein [Tieghemostelium lacteum]